MSSDPRKIVQIAGVGDTLYALCDDGTVFRHIYDHRTHAVAWELVDSIPQPKPSATCPTRSI
jgi:hypothetical protein